MARFGKSSDGTYHIKGKKYVHVQGSRAQVWHGTAYETSGGLTRSHIKMNKHGRIVSTKKSATAKKDKRLEKAGYFTKKGKFGFVKRDSSQKSRKSRKSRKSKK